MKNLISYKKTYGISQPFKAGKMFKAIRVDSRYDYIDIFKSSSIIIENFFNQYYMPFVNSYLIVIRIPKNPTNDDYIKAYKNFANTECNEVIFPYLYINDNDGIDIIRNLQKEYEKIKSGNNPTIIIQEKCL